MLSWASGRSCLVCRTRSSGPHAAPDDWSRRNSLDGPSPIRRRHRRSGATITSLGGSYDEFTSCRRRRATALAAVRPGRSRRSGAEEIKRRWEEAQDLIRENGVTYNVYGDPRGMDRPWQLDPIPLLIAPAECGTARSRPGPAAPGCST